jgi:hypothetical protein
MSTFAVVVQHRHCNGKSPTGCCREWFQRGHFFNYVGHERQFDQLVRMADDVPEEQEKGSTQNTNVGIEPTEDAPLRDSDRIPGFLELFCRTHDPTWRCLQLT